MLEVLDQPTASTPRIDAKSNGIADRNTPFIRNCWYVAGLTSEITRQPTRRTILEHDIVFYRAENGSPVAVQNRCPHRSFPLHTGYVSGDRIVCGYHGMQFNPDGSCAHVPALNAAPRAIRLDAYPLAEDGPLLWIWMGDPANPDYSKLIRQEWCTSSEWTHVGGYFHLKANYLGLHENLMDLTHFAFLHSKWELAIPEDAMAPLNIEQTADAVHQREVQSDVGMSPTYTAALGMKAPFGRKTLHTVRSPAIHEGSAVTFDSSEPPIEDLQHFVHITTPENQHATHYYWFITRSKAIDDKTLDEEFYVLGHGAFTEDKVALENIEELVARDHRPNFREKIIRSDEGGVRVLRMFARMAAQEMNAEGDRGVAVR